MIRNFHLICGWLCLMQNRPSITGSLSTELDWLRQQLCELSGKPGW
ncbi:hypothetical protein BF49_2528 [Bradyrhizobium sp.]|nr:hypothetical protein BF49_2528 [Bradyrhizobium sp.]